MNKMYFADVTKNKIQFKPRLRQVARKMTLPGCWYYIRDDNYIKSKFSIFFNMQSFPRIQRTYSAFNLLRIGWQDNCKDTLIGEHSYYLVGTSYGLTSLFAAERHTRQVKWYGHYNLFRYIFKPFFVNFHLRL